MPNITTTNVDVRDGLSNGNHARLKLIEKYEAVTPEKDANIGNIKRLWLKFTRGSRIGQKKKKLSTKYMPNKNISRDSVHFGRCSASIYLNKN